MSRAGATFREANLLGPGGPGIWHADGHARGLFFRHCSQNPEFDDARSGT